MVGGVDVDHHAAVLAEEAAAHVIEQVLQQGVVHRLSPPVGDAGGGVPIALRTSTKFISCFSAVMLVAHAPHEVVAGMDRAGGVERDDRADAQDRAEQARVGGALAAHEPAGLAQQRIGALGDGAGVGRGAW